MQIDTERESDRDAVHALNAAAFETGSEADLVDALREQAAPLASLVAREAGEVVGHILFSPVTLANDADGLIMGLAPMAVAEEMRGRGVGSALAQAGIDACRQLGAGAIVVLGHPDYYPRFGFRPACEFGLNSEYDVPDDVFMALELVPGFLDSRRGTVRYHAAFSRFS